jgi:hypothetical protein
VVGGVGVGDEGAGDGVDLRVLRDVDGSSEVERGAGGGVAGTC